MNSELSEAVAGDTIHSLLASNLNIPRLDAAAYCGQVYLTVALYDQRNINVKRRKRAGVDNFKSIQKSKRLLSLLESKLTVVYCTIFSSTIKLLRLAFIYIHIGSYW